MAGGRRIARELAVIAMPQLPKDSTKLEKIDLETLVAKAVKILCDYAKQNLSEAEAELIRANEELLDIEFEHPKNARAIDSMVPVPLNSGQLREQIIKINRALTFASEALDIPDVALNAGKTAADVACKNCGHLTEVYVQRAHGSEIRDYAVELVEVYLAHKQDIDSFIKMAKAKWNLDRMVSVDRDILRLACAEALYMHDVPVNVAVSEAVELCHRFADDKAAKFVNGVLGYLADEAKRFRLYGEFSAAELPTEESINAARRAASGEASEEDESLDEANEFFEPARRGRSNQNG